jgi:hypothetical protein
MMQEEASPRTQLPIYAFTCAALPDATQPHSQSEYPAERCACLWQPLLESLGLPTVPLAERLIIPVSQTFCVLT